MKLPAAVAFPTNDRLLQRIEESRRALPANNIKPLRKRREPLNVVSASVQRARDVEAQPPPRVEAQRPPTLQLVRIEELYLTNKVALRQR